MKFATSALTMISILVIFAAKSALANPADIQCTVLNSGGITLDFSVDPTSGGLLGLAVYTVPDQTTPPQTPAPSASATTNFPIGQIQNFWIDLQTMKVHGVDASTHQPSIFINYDRSIELGRVTMNLPGYNLDNNVLTCVFD